jgi:carboxypeptidase PM20D1
MEAASALLAEDFQPQRTIMFAFGHDEELTGSKGAGGSA